MRSPIKVCKIKYVYSTNHNMFAIIFLTDLLGKDKKNVIISKLDAQLHLGHLHPTGE